MYSSNSTINDKNKDNLARNIRYLRNKRGLTQKELGDALFISNTEICQYEMTTDSKHHRYPKPEMLTSIAQFFGISIDDLLNHDLEANNQVINVSISKMIQYIKTVFPTTTTESAMHNEHFAKGYYYYNETIKHFFDEKNILKQWNEYYEKLRSKLRSKKPKNVQEVFIKFFLKIMIQAC